MNRKTYSAVFLKGISKYGRNIVLVLLTTSMSFVLLGTIDYSNESRKFASKPSCCGPSCRQTNQTVEFHYDESYFEWQKKWGMRRAKERDWNEFLKTTPNMTVADLGAGGGHILALLNVRRKIAVEINPVAQKAIEKVYPGEIEVYTFPEDLPGSSIDMMISLDALEHMECPLTEMKEMWKKVKPGGSVIITIKNEGISFLQPWEENNIHQHLYTWSHQQLYNFIRKAGFRVHTFEPSFEEIRKGHLQKVLKYSKFDHDHDALHIWARGVKL